MKNWYSISMPTVKDVAASLPDIVAKVKALAGVKKLYVTGSFVQHREEHSYPLKDLDLIAVTVFDSGDLMAIDAGPDSPLKMAASELSDFGFDPTAVLFTKKYTALTSFNLDHWAVSADDKLLHWGCIPETIEEWQEVHEEAEKYAAKVTGYNRLRLAKQSENARFHWQQAYSESVKKVIGKHKLGWYPSDHPASEILATAQEIA